MQPNHQKQAWYCGLSAKGKELLARLIASQKAQGDTKELQVPEDTINMLQASKLKLMAAKRRPMTTKHGRSVTQSHDNYLE